MAQILWRPIMDDLDRRMFVFASEFIPGWESVDGWHGVDIDDPDVRYSLETARRGNEIRGIVEKFIRYKTSRVVALPAPVPAEVIAEAANHLGLDKYATKLVEESPTQSVWIISEQLTLP